jgi:hypothetical protein
LLYGGDRIQGIKQKRTELRRSHYRRAMPPLLPRVSDPNLGYGEAPSEDILAKLSTIDRLINRGRTLRL